MNTEQAANYLTAVLSTAFVGVFIPVCLLLGLLLGLRAMMLHAINHPDGFVGRMMSDAEGKPSSDRLVKLVAVIVTMWMGAVVVFSQPQLIIEAMGLLMVGWGGADVTKHWLSNRQPQTTQTQKGDTP